MYYDLLMERGYKYEELYNMTLKELKISLRNINKGLAYNLYKQSILTGLAFVGKLKEPEKMMPELYPPKKTMIMPEWVKEKYIKKRGGK